MARARAPSGELGVSRARAAAAAGPALPPARMAVTYRLVRGCLRVLATSSRLCARLVDRGGGHGLLRRGDDGRCRGPERFVPGSPWSACGQRAPRNGVTTLTTRMYSQVSALSTVRDRTPKAGIGPTNGPTPPFPTPQPTAPRPSEPGCTPTTLTAATRRSEARPHRTRQQRPR